MWCDYWLQLCQYQWNSWERTPVKSCFPVTNSILNFYQRNLYWHFWDGCMSLEINAGPLIGLAVISFKKNVLQQYPFAATVSLYKQKEPPISHHVWELLSSSAHKDILVSVPHAKFISTWALFVLRSFMHSHAATPQASFVNALCQVGLRYYSSPKAFI